MLRYHNKVWRQTEWGDKSWEAPVPWSSWFTFTVVDNVCVGPWCKCLSPLVVLWHTNNDVQSGLHMLICLISTLLTGGSQGDPHAVEGASSAYKRRDAESDGDRNAPENNDWAVWLYGPVHPVHTNRGKLHSDAVIVAT